MQYEVRHCCSINVNHAVATSCVIPLQNTDVRVVTARELSVARVPVEERTRRTRRASPGAIGAKRLKDLLARQELPRIGILPVTDYAVRLYETVGMVGEGIATKDTPSLNRPGGSALDAAQRQPGRDVAPDGEEQRDRGQRVDER